MLAPWKKSYDKPKQHIKKKRHYFANKGPSSQSYGFPVVIYGCESWTIKKAEHQRTDAFELWEILKEMGIPDHLICLLRNLYAGQEATVRTGHGTTDWFQIGKGVCQGFILSPCLFNL